MSTTRQGDLFGNEAADEDTETPEYHADPDQVREELHKILAEMKAADAAPSRFSLYKTIFPQMTNWLPDDEAAQLRFDFEAELVRLKIA